ncbi:MAG: metallophosphoesterase [Nanoarchaeota archaeon]|nr:metallophosphoesterase [Nanoarchaeota archaeon]
MNWIKQVKLLEYGALIKKENILIIADLHLGYETYLQKKGIFIPKNQFSETIKRIKKMVEQTKPKKIIFAGDIKHDFENMSYEARITIKKLINNFKKQELIFLKGNHDTFLKHVLEKHGYKFKETFETQEFLITHGHKKIKTKKTLIIGHEHPAIMLKDELGTQHKFKCHLVGEKLLVIPAISVLATGTIVNENKKALSPLITNLDELKPIIQELEFPKIKKLKKIVK